MTHFSDLLLPKYLFTYPFFRLRPGLFNQPAESLVFSLQLLETLLGSEILVDPHTAYLLTRQKLGVSFGIFLL